MKIKIKILLLVMPMCLLLCFMSSTYSRYVADATSDVKMSFAQWQILVNSNDITNNSTNSVVLTPVINKSDYIEDNKIAPSSSGYFDINIDPTNVDVSFNYNISLDVLNEDIPDLLISEYAILDANYVETDNITKYEVKNNLIDGSLDYDKSKGFSPFTIRVYFEWYEGVNETMSDDADTLIAADAENNSLEIKVNIKFEQKLSSDI